MQKSAASYERYQRQILLQQIGEEGQRNLLAASILVIGAGGLGCPALQYLVAAGIGKIGLVDDDLVSLHNLHRQVLYTTADAGLRKADVAAKRLREMNPDIEINSFSFRITNKNALRVLTEYDFALDATDNFATRYLINDACVLLNKPLVYGAVSQFEGQVAVFNCGEKPVNYRDLFPQPPQSGSVLNCAEAGVLGVLPGIVGTMQATEVIKLITGIGQPLINRLLTYDALTHNAYVFELTPRPETALLIPKDAEAFEAIDYEWLCNTTTQAVDEIEPFVFNSLLQSGEATAVDVRDEGEQPTVTEFKHLKIPLSQLGDGSAFSETTTILLFCQSGKRSREAATLLSSTFGKAKKFYSLKGGILQWKREHGKES